MGEAHFRATPNEARDRHSDILVELLVDDLQAIGASMAELKADPEVKLFACRPVARQRRG